MRLLLGFRNSLLFFSINFVAPNHIYIDTYVKSANEIPITIGILSTYVDLGLAIQATRAQQQHLPHLHVQTFDLQRANMHESILCVTHTNNLFQDDVPF